MVFAVISVESTECEQTDMIVYRETVKLFGIPIYKRKAAYSASRLDRTIGFQALPTQLEYVEDGDDD